MLWTGGQSLSLSMGGGTISSTLYLFAPACDGADFGRICRVIDKNLAGLPFGMPAESLPDLEPGWKATRGQACVVDTAHLVSSVFNFGWNIVSLGNACIGCDIPECTVNALVHSAGNDAYVCS